ncbi:FtsX-like permease family protein [Jeotgalibaca caeni]|uniref:FtsX-like permease family protein n=1 Tax=Jeotgalibaca caeni TaxID=3028623 RepID=UPI00237DA734|nr:FtsX-like permease family protein [Jeotgalibaca caeni]MDE1547700.1 FtsX-like permease family protein [Jeotgalibaca caeni]
MGKKQALWKDIWKTIGNNKARFLALFAIILLGVGFYAGISATGPDMIDTADQYYEENQLFDVRVLSTYGIQEEDREALAEVDGLQIEPIQTIDVAVKDGESLLRIFPYSTNRQSINDYAVVEGRLPETSGEIALDAIPFLLEAYEIGDTISFQQEDHEDAPVSLNNQEYEVVGFVQSPLYIEEISRGTSQVGKGTLDGFGVVVEEDLTGDLFTEMFVRVKEAQDFIAYSAEYEDSIATKSEEIELALNGRPMERINEIRAEGRKEIFEGQEELADAREQLEEAEQELADAKTELKEARATYEENLALFQSEIQAAEEEIAAQQATIDQGLMEYKEGLAAWEAGAQEYAAAKESWDMQRETFLQQAEGAPTLEELAQNPFPTPEGQQLAQQIQRVLEGEAEIAMARNQLQMHIQTLEAQEAELQGAKTQLEADKQTAAALLAEVEALRAALGEQPATLANRQAQLQTIRQYIAEPIEEWTPEEIAERRQIVEAQGNVTLLYQPFLQFLNGEIPASAVPIAEEEGIQNQIIAQMDALAQTEAALAAYQMEERERVLSEQSQQLEQAKSLVDDNAQELDNQSAALQEARTVLENEVQKAMQDIRGQVAAADQQFAEQGAALEQARTELEAARKQLEEGQVQLDSGREQLAAERAEGEAALADALAQIEAGEAEYEEGLRTFEAERADAEEEIQEGEVALSKAIEELQQLDEPVYFVQDRSINPGYEGYGDNANRISAIASIFPVFFFMIAALVSFTTMTRMVDEQRQQMGTMKGLGYSNFDIAKKFIVYAGIACVAGTALGLLAGYHLFPTIIFQAYSSLYNLPDVEINYYLSYALIAFLVALLCTVGPALLATTRSLRENPSALMRPKAPKKGKRVLLERIPFIWNHLGFNAKITVRNLVRYKVRNSMTVIGVAGCMALILTGFALRNSISGLADTQFDEIMKYDAIVALQPDLTNEQMDTYIEEVESYPEIFQHLPVLLANYRAEKAGISNQEVNVMVPETKEELSDFVRLQERDKDVSHQLTDEGAIISEKLAILLEVEPGDEVVLQDDEEATYSIPIQAVTENYTGHYLYLSPDLYESIFSESFEPSGDLLLYEADAAWQSTFAEEMMENAPVALITFMDLVDQAFADTLASLDIITLVLIISAAALAFVVLYNLTNINVSERIRELSTIKVLGFYPLEVSMYIYRETFILTLIGILVGFGFGNVLATILLKMVEVDFMLFPITILPLSYVYSAILTLIFSFVVMVIMHYKLKNVDMMEALKSVE